MTERKSFKNDPIRVGLIGLGFIGKIHAHAYDAIPYCFSKPKVQAEIGAILRTHTGKDNALLKMLGSPLETDRPDEFMQQHLDMVDLCTPNYLHLEQVEMALTKSLHISCEKPLAVNLKQARRIAQAVEKAGVQTHTAFTMRYTPALQQAKSIIASGVLGEIYNFRVYLFHNSYMDPLRPTSWRLRKETSGGGSLADLGIHSIDLIRYLLGDVQWVQCRTRTLIAERPKSAGSSEMVPVDVDDWALCLLGLESGAQGSIEVTRMSGGITDTSRLQIFGSRGSLEVDFNNPQQAAYYDRHKKQILIGAQDFPLAEGQRPLEDIFPPTKLSLGHFIDEHFASIMDFLLCIQEKKPSPVNFNSALRAQEILEAAYVSAERGAETIHLPLP